MTRIIESVKRKHCTGCRTDKSLTAEYWSRNKGSRDGWRSQCKTCSTASVIASRRKHPDVTRRNDTAGVQRRTQRQLAYVARLKAEGSCADCGGAAEEFDHVPGRGEKVAAISDLLGKWTSWTRLLAELRKCELVCTACHKRRTKQRRRAIKYPRLVWARRQSTAP